MNINENIRNKRKSSEKLKKLPIKLQNLSCLLPYSIKPKKCLSPFHISPATAVHLSTNTFLGYFLRQPQDHLTFRKAARLSQRRTENFQHVHFPCVFGRCLEVARQLQGSLEMAARLTYEFARSDTWATANQSLRLSHEGRRVNARTTCGCLEMAARLTYEFGRRETSISC